MAGWVAIEEKDVLDRLNTAERAGYDMAGDSEPEDDKLPGNICQVTEFVRGCIRSCPQNQSFGPEGTVPPECVYHAVSLIRHALVGSAPNSASLQGDERQTEDDAAREYFRRIASCEQIVSPHDATDPNQRTTAPHYGGSEPKICFSY